MVCVLKAHYNFYVENGLEDYWISFEDAIMAWTHMMAMKIGRSDYTPETLKSADPKWWIELGWRHDEKERGKLSFMLSFIARAIGLTTGSQLELHYKFQRGRRERKKHCKLSLIHIRKYLKTRHLLNTQCEHINVPPHHQSTVRIRH